jgi:hypothetical protein
MSLPIQNRLDTLHVKAECEDVGIPTLMTAATLQVPLTPIVADSGDFIDGYRFEWNGYRFEVYDDVLMVRCSHIQFDREFDTSIDGIERLLGRVAPTLFNRSLRPRLTLTCNIPPIWSIIPKRVGKTILPTEEDGAFSAMLDVIHVKAECKSIGVATATIATTLQVPIIPIMDEENPHDDSFRFTYNDYRVEVYDDELHIHCGHLSFNRNYDTSTSGVERLLRRIAPSLFNRTFTPTVTLTCEIHPQLPIITEFVDGLPI